jgi:hypothetical protein
VVPCGRIGPARTHQCHGSSGAGKYERPDAAITMGEYERSYAAVALAGSQHQRSDAAFTLGKYQRTDATVPLVISGTIPR